MMTSEIVDMAATRARNEANWLFTVKRLTWGLVAALVIEDTKVRVEDMLREGRVAVGKQEAGF
jgi:hypothetical protein